MQWKGLPLVIFGNSGASSEVSLILDAINETNYTNVFDFRGFVIEKNIKVMENERNSIACYDYDFKTYAKQYPQLGVVIGVVNPDIREKIYINILKDISNVVYPNLIHPKANIPLNSDKDLGMGNIIYAGASIASNVRLNKFIYVNLNSTIGHDTIIEDFVSINPLAVISGNVHIEKKCLIGAGANIKEKLIIAQSSVIGMGAIIVDNIEANATMICKKAEKINR